MELEVSRTAKGIMTAIEWLRALGRPILAAKMERELLDVNGSSEERISKCRKAMLQQH